MYCTTADIISRRLAEAEVIQLTDDENTGSLDQAVVDDIISEATELINSYVRSHYPVPLSPVPGLIRNIAVDLCVYALYQRRPHIDTPDGVVRGHKAAREDLRRIQLRDITLDVAVPAASSGAAFVGNERRLTRDSMKGLL
mgnify:CR=1 FL=1